MRLRNARSKQACFQGKNRRPGIAGASPGHTILYQALCNALGSENVRRFPVSSRSGASVLVDGHDAPRAGPIRSFGVLNPFPWIADRRAVLDLGSQ